MSVSRFALVVAFGLLIAGCSEPVASSNSAGDEKTVSTSGDQATSLESRSVDDSQLFTVAEYDPERNAIEDLEMTTKLAQDSRKRILIEVGGKW